MPIQVRTDDRTWTAFAQIAKALEWSDSDKGKAYFDAINSLALTNYWIHGPVLIAQKERTHVSREPIPKVWEGETQVLVAAGDVTGDSKPEYILGAGWSGPMGGVVAVYDLDFRKIAELEMESIWGIELVDLTNDGTCEILCWEDQHHGSGLWQRRLTLLKYVEGTGLAVVWRGTTYNQASEFLDTHRIRIEQRRERPAVIVRTSISQQWPQFVEGKPVIRKSRRHEVVSYVWDRTAMRFENQSDGISEPSASDDGVSAP